MKSLEEEINLIKSKMNIKPKQKRSHEYGCVMLYFDFPEIKEIHRIIDPNDVYIDPDDDSYGLEDEPHITLLFGLHEGVSSHDVKKVLSNHKYNGCNVHNASLFENEKYDVLKFDVEGNDLHETNNELKKFPYTSDFPDYHPHMTIGYLKPGTGKKYTKKLNDEDYVLVPLHAIYSKTDGTKEKIPIRNK